MAEMWGWMSRLRMVCAWCVVRTVHGSSRSLEHIDAKQTVAHSYSSLVCGAAPQHYVSWYRAVHMITHDQQDMCACVYSRGVLHVLIEHKLHRGGSVVWCGEAAEQAATTAAPAPATPTPPACRSSARRMW